MSYKKLDVWQLARELVIEIHEMTIKKLPKHDTESLKDDKLYQWLHEKLQLLGKKLNTFVQAIESGHISEK